MPLGDPEEIDAILTSYKMGLEEGERQTVEKIVAWLRNSAEGTSDPFHEVANLIEMREWKWNYEEGRME